MTCGVWGMVASAVGSQGAANTSVLPPLAGLAAFCSSEEGGILCEGNGGYMSDGEESTSTRV